MLEGGGGHDRRGRADDARGGEAAGLEGEEGRSVSSLSTFNRRVRGRPHRLVRLRLRLAGAELARRGGDRLRGVRLPARPRRVDHVIVRALVVVAAGRHARDGWVRVARLRVRDARA